MQYNTCSSQIAWSSEIAALYETLMGKMKIQHAVSECYWILVCFSEAEMNKVSNYNLIRAYAVMCYILLL